MCGNDTLSEMTVPEVSPLMEVLLRVADTLGPFRENTLRQNRTNSERLVTRINLEDRIREHIRDTAAEWH